jgi:methylglutaconyl-CoA hydratase
VLSYSTILVEEKERVCTITLNRPERRNAMTPTMQEELIRAFEAAAKMSDTLALVIRGAGESFCAGLDLSVLQTLQSQTPAEHRADAQRIAKLFRTLYELPMPTIAAVNGAAIAGGTGLAMISDFTLAVPQAKFGFTEVRIGFIPALVSVFLALQIGDKRSRDLLLTGRLFDAKEGERLGLVNEVVAAEDIEKRVAELIRQLSANSPASLRATKKLMTEQNREWLDRSIANAIEANSKAREHADFSEGVTSFLEKRKALWK